MSTNTSNYNLVKPDYADDADIGDINGNMDIIDSALASKQNATDNNLTTTSKNVVGAINELDSEVATNTSNIDTLQAQVPGYIKMENFTITTTSGYASLTFAQLGIEGKTLDNIMCTTMYNSLSGGNLYASCQISATGINVYLRNGISDTVAANGTYIICLIYKYH